MAIDSKPTRSGWKTCTRGHKFRGARCPICWPGGETTMKRGRTKRLAKKAVK